MSVYNVAIVLWRWGPATSLRSQAWFKEYFFHPVWGQAGYWLKQSDGEVALAGTVFDWVFDSAPQRDFSSREQTSKTIVDLMESDHSADLTPYHSIVVVLGLDGSIKSNGGSTSVQTRHGWHHALVMRAGDPFDFVSHELGHGIVGPPHSFTWNTAYQVIGENPGGYGHRHCIMSAMAYGGNGEARHNAQPPYGLLPEYQNIGPSLNGVTARSRGWIDTHDIVLTPGFDAEFEIRARQWMGRDPALPPQGIHLSRPDGNSYVIEFYENWGWDAGLSRPHLIVTQDKGGIADINYPGKHSGTFLDSIPVAPAALTGPRAVINLLGPMGIMPLSYDPARHVLRFRLTAHTLSGGVIAVAESVSTQPLEVGSGRVTFLPGERFCVTGEWSFQWVENRQTVTIDASHPRVYPGSSAAWSVDGMPLDPGKDRIKLTKTVMVADPKRLDLTSTIPIEIGYRIDAIPNGSRLTLTNRPQDESYSVEAAVTFTTHIASGTVSRMIDFTGRECRFPPEFTEQWSECLGSFLRQKLHDSQTVLVFDPTAIPKVQPGLEDLPMWLDALAHTLDDGDREGFELAAATLRHRLRQPGAELRALNRRDVGPWTREEMPPISPAARFLEIGDSGGADGVIRSRRALRYRRLVDILRKLGFARFGAPQP